MNELNSDDRKQEEWLFRAAGPEPPVHDSDFLPLTSAKLGLEIDPASREFLEDWNIVRMYEHIAGPSCNDSQGYLGSLITVDEMRGCHTVQTLILKDEGWLPETDDMHFEKDGNYVLTGLSDHMPSSGWNAHFVPTRHGVENRDTSYDTYHFDVSALFLPHG
jgi:hypothetical protein